MSVACKPTQMHVQTMNETYLQMLAFLDPDCHQALVVSLGTDTALQIQILLSIYWPNPSPGKERGWLSRRYPLDEQGWEKLTGMSPQNQQSSQKGCPEEVISEQVLQMAGS